LSHVAGGQKPVHGGDPLCARGLRFLAAQLEVSIQLRATDAKLSGDLVPHQLDVALDSK
jgi:hypothetical protein